MNHAAPVFIPNDEVTIIDDRLGPLRLVVASTEPAINGGPGWVILTDRNGYGRWRRRTSDVIRGWGD